MRLGDRGVRAGAIGAALLLGMLHGRALPAQRADSARIAPRAATVDTTTRVIPAPPLSPRRAFLYSLALPGYAQSILGRPTAGTIFVLAEVIGISMLRESNAELREARRLRGDSVVYFGNDPVTGVPVRRAAGFTDELIDVRRGHREDWVAALIANHFFAAADAYVAAHLWDLPTQISVTQGQRGTVVAARLRW